MLTTGAAALATWCDGPGWKRHFKGWAIGSLAAARSLDIGLRRTQTRLVNLAAKFKSRRRLHDLRECLFGATMQKALFSKRLPSTYRSKLGF